MRILACLAALTLMTPGAAAAQEAIATAPAADQPPPAETAGAAEDPSDWARRVLDGRPAAPDPQAAPRGCRPVSDGKPHGEVWAGIGTRGYRELGGVVTQQIGECASVTIGVSKVEGPRGRRR